MAGALEDDDGGTKSDGEEEYTVTSLVDAQQSVARGCPDSERERKKRSGSSRNVIINRRP